MLVIFVIDYRRMKDIRYYLIRFRFNLDKIDKLKREVS